MKKALRVITTVSLAVALTGPVASAASASRVPRVAQLTADQLVALSMTNARAAGWCTNVSHGSAVGFSFGSTTQSGPDLARQSIHLNRATGQALILRGRLYVKESVQLLAAQFGPSHARWANTWISVPHTDAAYASISSGLLFSSMLAQVRPAGTLRRSSIGIVRGVATIAISGSANPQLGLTKGVETLFVAAAAPYLPVELLAGGRSQGVPTSLTVMFSQWGHRFRVAAPTAVTPISSTNLP